MTLRRVAVPATVPGALWLSAMPGRFEPWSRFLVEASRARLGLVACLTPRDELASLSPDYEHALVQGTLPFAWLHLPMRNFGLPDDEAAFRAGIEQLGNSLLAGQAVMLHCAAGMGRTGSAAACVLKRLGLPAHEALQRVRDPGSNPQNASQAGFVDWF